MIELTPNFDLESKKPLYVQLYTYIKNEINNERIAAHERLPSIRNLSKSLDMSRTTIENTYHQLLVEGYIYSLPQKGYFVSEFDKIFDDNNEKINTQNKQELAKKHYPYDLKNEYVQDGNFNFSTWKKYMNKVINYESEKLLISSEIQGEIELREEIVRYVYQSRGVSADVNRVIIGAGVQSLLNILTRIMKEIKIRSCGIEDPGFNRAKDIFIHNGFDIIPLPIIENGIDMDKLYCSNTRLCYVSPSHQFPTGTIMSVEKRMKLIKWAKENDGYIIEDDYNGELRYSGKPIPAMQSFDRDGNVIYLGSFSTILIPGIRISYMILPSQLMALYQKYKSNYAQTASKLDQLSLALFMKEGMFGKHIRRLKTIYSKKNRLFINAIKKYMGDKVEIGGLESGLHIVLKINTIKTEKKIMDMANEKGIIFSTISDYMLTTNNNDKPIIILCYKGISFEDIDKVVDTLSRLCL